MKAYLRIIFVMLICQLALAVPAPQPLDAAANSELAGAAPKDLDTANTFLFGSLGLGGYYGGYGGYGGYGYGYPGYGYGGYGYGYPYGRSYLWG